MRNFFKGIIITILALGVVLSGNPSTTYAATGGYVIKDSDTGEVYLYNKDDLVSSYINHQYDSGDNSLYLDFNEKLKDFGFYAFVNDSGDYVDYTVIRDAFLQNPGSFNLTDFLSSSQATPVNDLPSTVTKITSSNGEITETSIDTGSTKEEPKEPEVIDIY